MLAPQPLTHRPQPLTQRPHAPAEVVGVVAEIAHRLVRLPILAEAVRAAGLTGVAMTVSCIVTLQKRGVHRAADARSFQGRGHGPLAAQHHFCLHRHDASILAVLADRGVVHLGWLGPRTRAFTSLTAFASLT